jgi:AGCS family alanine or glycine:cation symporter
VNIIGVGTAIALGCPRHGVWDLADALNALMTLPNIIAILLLSPEIAKMTKYYVYKNRIDKINNTPIPLRT